jgi:glycosyltransferase involved in cell wall biosynthesis
MKILHTPGRIYTTGGVEQYVHHLTRELKRRGHDITIISSDITNAEVPRQDTSVRLLRHIGIVGNTPITPGFPLNVWKEDFDIIHTHLPTPWSADWSAIVAGLKEKPFILTYHSAITGTGLTRVIAELYNRTALFALFSAADRIILARSRFLPESLHRFREKLEIIPIGVDGQEFFPSEGEMTCDIFFLSVLDEFHGFKGIDVFFSAIQRVKEKIPSLRVVIGGGGSRLATYRGVAESMGLGSTIHFTGYIPQHRVREYYDGCSVFVLPSLSPELETFGIVLLEAMACGRPVITTEAAGMADDIIRYGTGIVIRMGDPEALAEAILTVLLDDALGKRMGLAGRRLIETTYDWKIIGGRIEQLYKDVL